jgi:hypothetical protein
MEGTAGDRRLYVVYGRDAKNLLETGHFSRLVEESTKCKTGALRNESLLCYGVCAGASCFYCSTDQETFVEFTQLILLEPSAYEEPQ